MNKLLSLSLIFTSHATDSAFPLFIKNFILILPPSVIEFIGHFFMSLSNSFVMIYMCIKLYRVLCFTQMTFEQMPLFNPYIWPLSVIRVYTIPYFMFWFKLIPPLRLGRYTLNISHILGIEFLLSCLLTTNTARIFCIAVADEVFRLLAEKQMM